MIILENTLISDDLLEKKFICNIEACKGACCIEGDSGAPLEESEVEIIEKYLPSILEELDPEHTKFIEDKGFYEKDSDGDMVTTCLDDGRCCFVTKDERGVLGCAIENAHSAGKIDFKKPISCHLYPVRVKKLATYTTLNYHQWNICSEACALGEKEGVRVFEFCKDALIRRFGENWYQGLVAYDQEQE